MQRFFGMIRYGYCRSVTVRAADIKMDMKYLNQYKAADEESKDIAKRLINLEGKLVFDIRCFL